jgi:Ca2+-binding EF-hand superfamily protein
MIWKLTTLAVITAGLCTSAFIGANASNVEGVRAKFREIDANGDRALQCSEIRAARATIFYRMDADRNGVLDANEIETVRKVAASHKARSTRGDLFSEGDIAQRMTLMDANRDGRIGRDEFAGYVPPRLRAADRNGDGTLSMRELRSLRPDAPANNP